ncbi:hypothetical protein BDZ91DRAFT_722005 [Kalaharituber pfeilii]|nr:hypothetical protein BDZ91DRAFT_722005 [Kalaharituber pfeilii]
MLTPASTRSQVSISLTGLSIMPASAQEHALSTYHLLCPSSPKIALTTVIAPSHLPKAAFAVSPIAPYRSQTSEGSGFSPLAWRNLQEAHWIISNRSIDSRPICGHFDRGDSVLGRLQWRCAPNLIHLCTDTLYVFHKCQSILLRVPTEKVAGGLRAPSPISKRGKISKSRWDDPGLVMRTRISHTK